MFSFLTLRLKVAEAVEWTGALWLVGGNGGFAAWLTAQKNKAKRKWERRKQNIPIQIAPQFLPNFAAALLVAIPQHSYTDCFPVSAQLCCSFAVAIPQYFYTDCSSLSPDFASTLL
ncbi:hypothetical protein TIFTF001_042288 [Ficus carica]|uniref:Uncharacterized protein n=1 Tax=Ficus carica TaxID=3494 RepID=A0AA87ZJX4_FICCA|nr:hypothetical protein TIFTF001_042288 [Ficus carica]